MVSSVRIRVRVGMPVPEYGFWYDAYTATNGRNGYVLPIPYTQAIIIVLAHDKNVKSQCTTK